jgi:2-pyrone-4,6-dicarboxylate lactonase
MARAPDWVPEGACDSHVHLFGPFAEFPLADDRSYTPPDSPLPALQATLAGMGFGRAVIVNATGYGFDKRILEAALRADPRRLRGVAVLPPDHPVADLPRMHDLGVRGMRLNLFRRAGENLYRGGAGLETLRTLGPAMAEMGWHVQVWVTTLDLAEVLPELERFPGQIVIDHMGRVVPSALADDPGFALLCKLLREDRFHAKLCGWDRLSEAGGGFADSDRVARALVAAAPDKLVWGSDWPHVAYFDRPPPSEAALLAALYRSTDNEGQRRRILVDNPARLYGFDTPPHPREQAG